MAFQFSIGEIAHFQIGHALKKWPGKLCANLFLAVERPAAVRVVGTFIRASWFKRSTPKSVRLLPILGITMSISLNDLVP